MIAGSSAVVVKWMCKSRHVFLSSARALRLLDLGEKVVRAGGGLTDMYIKCKYNMTINSEVRRMPKHAKHLKKV